MSRNIVYCAHCNGEFNLIKKEYVQEVEEFLQKVENSQERPGSSSFVLATGPKYRHINEFKRDAFGNLKYIDNYDEITDKAKEDAKKLKKDFEDKFIKWGFSKYSCPYLSDWVEHERDSSYYYGMVIIGEKDIIEKAKKHWVFENTSETCCPRCKQHNTLDLSDPHNEKFDKNNAESKLLEIKKSYKKNLVQQVEYDRSQIDVKEYLKCLIDIGRDVYYLEEKLKKLLVSNSRNARDICDAEIYFSNDNVEDVVIDKKGKKLSAVEIRDKKLSEYGKRLRDNLKEAKRNLDKVTSINSQDFDKICELNHLEKPISPHEPIKPKGPKFPSLIPIISEDLIMPKEPVLEKVSFFHKKAINKRNQDKMNEYENKLKKYNEAIKKRDENKKMKSSYDKAYKQYLENELKQYNLEYEEYKKGKEDFQKKYVLYQKERKLLLEKEKKRLIENVDDEIMQNIQKQEEEVKQFEAIYNEDKVKAALEFCSSQYRPAYNKMIFYEKEINECKEKLIEEYKLLNKVFSIGIIYPKYDNLIAWTTMYEYLETGRVSELTGPNGAYNLYESELRSNIIIGKLDVIISQLEQIKNNQYMLYCIMEEINESIKDVSQKIKEVSQEISSIRYTLSDTNGLLEEIKKNTNVIKYNSEKVAKYTEISANSTRALVFLKAIIG